MIENVFLNAHDVLHPPAIAWTEALRMDKPDVVLAVYPKLEAENREKGISKPHKGFERIHRDSISALKRLAQVKRAAAISAWAMRDVTITLRPPQTISHNT